MRQSKITTKGQITIPQELRHFLGVSAGDTIEFEQVNGCVQLKKHVPASHSLAGLLNGKSGAKRPKTIEEIEAAIAKNWSKESEQR